MGSRGHEVPSHACPFDKGIRGPNDVATAILPTRGNQFKSISAKMGWIDRGKCKTPGARQGAGPIDLPPLFRFS